MQLKPRTDVSGQSTPIDRLLAIMAQLRDPVDGCPWDIEQTFATIAPYTIEEAYEVAESIKSGDMDDFKKELGDLLLQVVFQAQMAAEQNLFNFDDVATAISDKLVYRHPHVFGDATATTAADVIPLWNAKKEAEKAKSGKVKTLADEGCGLPALMRAQKIVRKAKQKSVQMNIPDPSDPAQAMQKAMQSLQSDPNKSLVDMLWIITQIAEDKSVDLESEFYSSKPE